MELDIDSTAAASFYTEQPLYFTVFLSLLFKFITFFVLGAHNFILFLDLKSIGKFCDYDMIQITRGAEKKQKILLEGGVFYDYI